MTTVVEKPSSDNRFHAEEALIKEARRRHSRLIRPTFGFLNLQWVTDHSPLGQFAGQLVCDAGPPRLVLCDEVRW